MVLSPWMTRLILFTPFFFALESSYVHRISACLLVALLEWSTSNVCTRVSLEDGGGCIWNGEQKTSPHRLLGEALVTGHAIYDEVCSAYRTIFARRQTTICGPGLRMGVRLAVGHGAVPCVTWMRYLDPLQNSVPTSPCPALPKMSHNPGS